MGGECWTDDGLDQLSGCLEDLSLQAANSE